MKTSDPAARGFGPVDALILGASIALAIWTGSAGLVEIERAFRLGDTQARYESDKERMRRFGLFPMETSVGRFEQSRRALVDVGGRVLPILTLGVAAATFVRRGHRNRRAMRRVGVLTSAVAGVSVAALLGNEFALRRFFPGGLGFGHNVLIFDVLKLDANVSYGVSALWLVLALGRRWRVEPTWADRLGRIVGGAWIAYAILAVLLQYISLRP